MHIQLTKTYFTFQVHNSISASLTGTLHTNLICIFPPASQRSLRTWKKSAIIQDASPASLESPQERTSKRIDSSTEQFSECSNAIHDSNVGYFLILVEIQQEFRRTRHCCRGLFCWTPEPVA